MPGILRHRLFRRYALPAAGVAALAVGIAIYSTGRTAGPIPQAGWYAGGSGAWLYRKRITLNHRQVAGISNLTEFPVLVSVIDSELQRSASPAGTDILFTSADGVTKLSSERELYSRATGQLIAWLQVPTLSPSTDTPIYIYYGNPNASEQQDAANVWDGNYVIVAHFSNGSFLNVRDSTSNRNNGSLLNGKIGAAAGWADGGVNITDKKSAVDFGGANSLSNLTAITWEMWIKADGGYLGYLGHQSTADGNGNANTIRFLDGVFTYRRIWNNRTLNWKANTLIDLNTWYSLAVTYDGSTASHTPSIYLNGISDGATCATDFDGTCRPSGPMNFPRGDLYLGSGTTGVYDEFRYSNIVRSSDWIRTEYQNQAAPDRFYSIGREESKNRTGN